VTEEHGAVLIFDEMITALRWFRHGALSVYGITPDLSTWGKAIGNGFSASALASRRALLSTTHGAETTGLAAYLPFPTRTQNETWLPKSRFRAPSCAPGLSRSPRRRGYRSTWSSWDAPHVRCLRPQTTTANRPFRTLFVQELLRRGVLGQSLLISAAHTDTDINQTIDAAAGAPEMYTRAIEVGSTDGLLVGRHLARALREFTEPRRLRPDYITGTGGAA
jgi:glutamate-1-semialdehyde 2,1-aminomutase